MPPASTAAEQFDEHRERLGWKLFDRAGGAYFGQPLQMIFRERSRRAVGNEPLDKFPLK